MNSVFNLKIKNRKDKIKQNTLDYFHSKKLENINKNKKNLNEYKNTLLDLNKQYNNILKKKKLKIQI